MYVTTPGTAGRLAAQAAVTPMFWIDDVWVTGFLARDLHIQHRELNRWREGGRSWPGTGP